MHIDHKLITESQTQVNKISTTNIKRNQNLTIKQQYPKQAIIQSNNYKNQTNKPNNTSNLN